jgi:uncharacterized repeat protein (TIGR01451 family)
MCIETSLSNRNVDIGLEKSHSEPLIYGQEGVFHITATNHGDAEVTSFIVVDALPVGAKYTGWAPTEPWTCAGAPDPTCTFKSPAGLVPGAMTWLDLYVQLSVPEEATGKALKECATLILVDDQNKTNNKACDEITIQKPFP